MHQNKIAVIPQFYFDAYLSVKVMNMDAIVSLICYVGFPIAVSIYLLVRIESKL